MWGMLQRRLRALRRGVLLGRAAGFRQPSRLRVNGEWVPLRLPADPAMAATLVQISFVDCYELRRFRDVRTVIDVGANAGLFVLEARQRFPNATIHAYEPNRALALYLDHHAGHARASVFYEAIGASQGTAAIEVGDVTLLGRTVPGADVPVTSLAEAVDRIGGHVDLLKLDCEGAEWELLEASDAWPRIGAVTMEYHGDGTHDAATVRELVERRGFRILAADETPYGMVAAVSA